MKTTTSNILLVSVMALAPFLAYSADGVSEGKVKKISANSDQLTLQQLDASNPGNCGSTDQFVLPGSHNSFQQYYGTLNAALSSGATVQVTLTGCSGGGSIGYPLIEHIQIVSP